MAAFTFDCELEEKGADSFKIHCIGSQSEWYCKRRSKEEFEALKRDLGSAEALQGKVDLPQFDIGGDVTYFETYLNKLISNAVILRQPILHEFLNVPEAVQKTLAFITERPDGPVLLEGNLRKHYNKVEREAVVRYFKLTQDAVGATLRFFDQQHSINPVGAIRISGQTKLDKFRERGLENAFSVQQRGRTWIIECQNDNESYRWMTRIKDRISQAGVKKEVRRGPPVSIDSNDPAAVMLAQLRLENEQQNSKVELLENKLHDLQVQVEQFKTEIEKANERMEQAAEEVRGRLQQELSVDQENFDHIRRNLEEEVSRLEREKAAQPALADGKKGLMSWFGDGADSEDSEMDADQLDENYVPAEDDEKATEMQVSIEDLTEQDKMKNLTDEERAQIRMVHRHWNKHSHAHVHVHRHTHIHVEDEQGAVDNYPNTHTFEHHLTHTSGKMVVKKSKFF